MLLICQYLVLDRIVSAELEVGYGLFAGRVPNVWVASPFANSGVVQYGSRYSSPCQTAGDRTCFKAPETIYQISLILSLQALAQHKV